MSFSCTSGCAARRVGSAGSGARSTFASSSTSIPGSARQDGGGLAERVEIDHAVATEREAGESFHLVGVEQTRAHPLELVDDVVVDVVVDHARLFRGTDHRRVEGLRDEDVDHGHADVRRPVQVDGRIARSDADRGLAGRVGRLDDLGAAGRPDEVDPGVVEQVLRDLVGRVGDHLERTAAEDRPAHPRRAGSRQPARRSARPVARDGTRWRCGSSPRRWP